MIISYLKVVFILTFIAFTITGCPSSDSSGSNNQPPAYDGLHLLSVIYDGGDPIDIDDNIVTLYFSEEINQASLPITPIIDTAFTITGVGEIYARSATYSVIDNFVYKLEIILDSVSIEPQPGLTEIALAAGIISDSAGNPAENDNPSARLSAYKSEE